MEVRKWAEVCPSNTVYITVNSLLGRCKFHKYAKRDTFNFKIPLKIMIINNIQREKKIDVPFSLDAFGNILEEST